MLWLWWRPEAAATIKPNNWEPPNDVGADKRRKKKKKKKKKKKEKKCVFKKLKTIVNIKFMNFK